MILVDGIPVLSSASSSQGTEILAPLMEHPTLVSASSRLKATPERKVPAVDGALPARHVYVFQREYATVDPALVELVGTDEATTCAGLVIRNRKSGMTSVAHLDFVGVVDMGLSQMLSLVVDHEAGATLDVHLIGGYEDVPYEHVNDTTGSESHEYEEGYSLPLCSKIIEALQNSREIFHLQTLCILGHNTKRDSYGNPCPIISGFLILYLDQLCLQALIEDRDALMKLSGGFGMSDWEQIAFSLQQLPDSEILFRCSTSPFAEGPDFVENERRIWSYLIRYPDWRQTFPGRKPHIFERTTDGEWLRCG